jgi:RND family efflux transporter MFP subunit
MVLFIVFTGACSQQQRNQEELKKQIKEKKEAINKLSVEVSKLEQQLLADTSSNSSKIYNTPVVVKIMKPVFFEHFITVNGNVEARENAFISSETSGQIETIHVSEGQRVSKGQLLVTLNTDVIRNNIKEVKTNLQLATELYQKQKDLWDQHIGSELQYLQAKNNMESAQARLNTLQSQLDMALISAPFSGVVDDIMKKEGELAIPGVQLLELVNLDKLVIYAQVSEKYLNDVKKGEMVQVEFPAFPSVNREVPVVRTSQVINEQNRTFDVELNLDNHNEMLKPNLIATVRINDFQTDSAFVVPSIIIKEDIKGKFLFIAEGQGENTIAVKKYVVTGMSSDDQTMLKSGVNSGDRVITQGYNLVSDGGLVQINN